MFACDFCLEGLAFEALHSSTLSTDLGTSRPHILNPLHVASVLTVPLRDSHVLSSLKCVGLGFGVLVLVFGGLNSSPLLSDKEYGEKESLRLSVSNVSLPHSHGVVGRSASPLSPETSAESYLTVTTFGKSTFFLPLLPP